MRKTRKELIEQMPSWNEDRHDIVKVKYGDIPLVHWDDDKYNEWRKLSGTFSNILAVDAYIYTQNGKYSIYETLIGKIYISDDGRVLCGDVDVKYRGKTYTVYVNQMYGLDSLDIICIMSDCVSGFSNMNGMGSPSRKQYTKEMEEEVIDRILNERFVDYGDSVQEFMKAARKLYVQDTSNHIMEKTFDL